MQLIIALDLPSREACLGMARELAGLDLWLKVGLRGFYRDGRGLVEELKKIGDFKIFLDLKLHDIPKTMADAAAELAGLGVEMINIHASAGEAGMRAVMSRLAGLPRRPLVLGVSALTSFSEEEFQKIYHRPIGIAVADLARSAGQAGLDGMVCSVWESRAIKAALGGGFLTLTPGIRLGLGDSQDQKRIATPAQARENLSDFIVIGRPIYQAANPRQLCEEILRG